MIDRPHFGNQDIPRIFTLEMHQDDPSKCTSAKMKKFGLAKPSTKRTIPTGSIVLNPLGEVPITKNDRVDALRRGVVVIDCSWAKASDMFEVAHFNGIQRTLPALLAGNPTNYARMGTLSSVEAVAGALYIMNFFDHAKRLLSIYKWGSTFLTLNLEALEEYSKADSVEQIKSVEGEFFPQIHQFPIMGRTNKS